MLLLDTHVVLWLALEPTRISRAAEQAMATSRRVENGLAIAGCTLWEIALLHKKGRIQLDASIEAFLRRVEETYRVFALTHGIAVKGIRFGMPYPKDPADRQIGATALVYGLKLVTADQLISASGEVPCIW